MPTTKFSVVIPCYNDVRIKLSVASCLAQTYPPHEIIIVDDSSGPSTQSIIDEIVLTHRDQNVKAIFLKKNSGVSTARNIGIKSSIGDFVCLLDSDDVWHPEKLRKVNDFLSGIAEPVVIGHDYTYDWKDFQLEQQKESNAREISFAQILFRNPIMTPSLTIPRKINVMFSEDMRYAEDHDFLLRLAKKHKVLFLPDKLVFINRVVGSKGGLSGETWKMRMGEIRMYIKLAKMDWRFYPLIPFFLIYSLAKHVRRKIVTSLDK